jgi:hypothetical protein
MELLLVPRGASVCRVRCLRSSRKYFLSACRLNVLQGQCSRRAQRNIRGCVHTFSTCTLHKKKRISLVDSARLSLLVQIHAHQNAFPPACGDCNTMTTRLPLVRPLFPSAASVRRGCTRQRLQGQVRTPGRNATCARQGQGASVASREIAPGRNPASSYPAPAATGDRRLSVRVSEARRDAGAYTCAGSEKNDGAWASVGPTESPPGLFLSMEPDARQPAFVFFCFSRKVEDGGRAALHPVGVRGGGKRSGRRKNHEPCVTAGSPRLCGHGGPRGLALASPQHAAAACGRAAAGMPTCGPRPPAPG